jgi:hypothetical protein
MNYFSDITEEEAQMMLGYIPDLHANTSYIDFPENNLPTQVDWRK